ncbi:ribonuclease HI [candidate division CSSED10-310 bacterium]|uniref:Ribonuclease H n=1 Tax=candidate division CSSED10-310 bacterium TaxID=2855610 RepID=A0ABV6Z536_UNCC1
MAKGKKVYIVVKGRKPGLYHTWLGPNGAQAQISGVSGSLFKGFQTLDEAREWLSGLGDTDLIQKIFPAPKRSRPRFPTTNDSARALLGEGKVVLYTDGGAIKNPGPGGYGVVLLYKDHRKEMSGGFRFTTNNRMELLACIMGLKSLKWKCPVVVFTDSMYLKKGIVNGWARKWQANNWMRTPEHKAKNADLWAQLLLLCDKHDVEFHWVKGHSGNPDNERCDQLATAAAKQPKLPQDTGYNQSLTG